MIEGGFEIQLEPLGFECRPFVVEEIGVVVRFLQSRLLGDERIEMLAFLGGEEVVENDEQIEIVVGVRVTAENGFHLMELFTGQILDFHCHRLQRRETRAIVGDQSHVDIPVGKQARREKVRKESVGTRMLGSQDANVVRMNRLLDVLVVQREIVFVLLSVLVGNGTEESRGAGHEVIQNSAVVALGVLLKVVETADERASATAIDQFAPNERRRTFACFPLILLADRCDPLVPLLDRRKRVEMDWILRLTWASIGHL